MLVPDGLVLIGAGTEIDDELLDFARLAELNLGRAKEIGELIAAELAAVSLNGEERTVAEKMWLIYDARGEDGMVLDTANSLEEARSVVDDYGDDCQIWEYDARGDTLENGRRVPERSD